MPHKDKKEHAKYSLKYYHEHPQMKKKINDNERLKYWRNKYMKQFNCGLVDCEKLTEQQMKDDIKSGMCRV